MEVTTRNKRRFTFINQRRRIGKIGKEGREKEWRKRERKERKKERKEANEGNSKKWRNIKRLIALNIK